MGNFVMHELFPTICNMSLTASVVIVAVLVVRLLLRRAPKAFSYALWAVVLFRLICPVSVTSAVSLMGAVGAPVQERTQRTSAVEYVPADIVRSSGAPTVTTLPQETVPAADRPAENTAPAVTAPEPAAASPLSGPMVVLTGAWLSGMALLLAYSAVSMLRLRRRLVGAVLLEDNIYLADHIPSPFVMGLFRPKIYLPSTLKETERGYILRHEQYHIRRRDYLVKFLAFLALCVHWFNPLVWVAFVLAGKDMEMSCDEAVVKELGEDIRADYSASLLSLATGHRIVAGMPLAFGEGDTGGRIRNLLKWKRPRPWVIAVCAVVCVGLIVLCAVNPKGSDTPAEDTPTDQAGTGQWASVEAYVQHVMLSQTEAQYYAAGADGAVDPDVPHTAAVTDRKLEYLTKGGEVDGLAPDGVLEEWEYFYLVKFDADPASVAVVGGQYYDGDGYFALNDRHVVVALRHADGSYDILYDDPINDGGDFFGNHNTIEEAIYDWYVTDQGLDLPLYVEDWIDRINYNTEEGKPSDYPVHRYDVDGGYLYIPVSAWTMSTPERGEVSRYYTWTSSYDTGSQISVSYNESSMEEHITEVENVGFTAVDDTRRVWRQDLDGAHTRYYLYPAANGKGCWSVITYWTDLGISNYVHIFIEPQVMNLMAESFTPAADFSPAAGTAIQTQMVYQWAAEPDGRLGEDSSYVEIDVTYTVGDVDGVPSIISIDGVRAENSFTGWREVDPEATILSGQIIYQDEGKALVPVAFMADRGNGWEKFQTVVQISATGEYDEYRSLTKTELDGYNAVTDPFHDAEGNSVFGEPQPVQYFLMSYYDKVQDLNFRRFLNWFPGEWGISDAEFEALCQLPGWTYKTAEERGNTCRIPASSVKDVLWHWGFRSIDQLTNTEGTFYLPEYDAYYVVQVDEYRTWFRAERGVKIGEYVYLYGMGADDSYNVLTLRSSTLDEWYVVSYQHVGGGN